MEGENINIFDTFTNIQKNINNFQRGVSDLNIGHAKKQTYKIEYHYQQVIQKLQQIQYHMNQIEEACQDIQDFNLQPNEVKVERKNSISKFGQSKDIVQDRIRLFNGNDKRMSASFLEGPLKEFRSMEDVFNSSGNIRRDRIYKSVENLNHGKGQMIVDIPIEGECDQNIDKPKIIHAIYKSPRLTETEQKLK